MTVCDLSFRIQRESGGGLSARCIEFPAIITQGYTESELAYMMQDAADCYFDSCPEDLEKLQLIPQNKMENPPRDIPQFDMEKPVQCITQRILLKINA